MKKMPKAVIVTGVIGEDVHVTGIRILEHALRANNYDVHSLGIHNSMKDFIRKAVEVSADAILISSLTGHAAMLVEGFREKCEEAGLKNIFLSIGGQLVIHSEEWQKTEKTFLDMGFDYVAPPFQLPTEVIEILDTALCSDSSQGLELAG